MVHFPRIGLKVLILTAGLTIFPSTVGAKVAPTDDKDFHLRSSRTTGRHHLADGILKKKFRNSSLRGIRMDSAERNTKNGAKLMAKSTFQDLLDRNLAFNKDQCPPAIAHRLTEIDAHRHDEDRMSQQLIDQVEAAVAHQQPGDLRTIEQVVRDAIRAANTGSAPYFAAFKYCEAWLGLFGVQPTDFTTRANEAVFWSTRSDHVRIGGPNQNMVAAKAWARANRKKTLEMTTGGRYLDSLGMFDEANYHGTNGYTLSTHFLQTQREAAGIRDRIVQTDIRLADKSNAAYTMNCASYYFADSVDRRSTVIHSFFEDASTKTAFNPVLDPDNHNPTFFNMEMPTLTKNFPRGGIKAVFHYSGDVRATARSNKIFACVPGSSDTFVTENNVETQEQDYGIPLYYTMLDFLISHEGDQVFPTYEEHGTI